MSYEYSEDALIEQATQDVLEELGWSVVAAWHKESFGEDGLLGREDKSEVVLTRYLLQALKNLNPNHPDLAYEQAVELITQNVADQTLGKINKEKSKEYREKNKEEVLKKKKEYREKNKDTIKQYNKEYYKNKKNKKE